MANFIDEFEVSVQKFPNNTAIIYLDSEKMYQTIVYNRLQVIINAITTKLHQIIPKHSCISVLFESNHILPAVLLSIQKHQSAFFCIDSKISATHLLDLVQCVKLEWIIIDKNIIKKEIMTCLDKNGSIITSIFVSENNIKCTLSLWRINTEISDAKLYKNVSYVIQTSGTTGRNKVIKVLHKCIMSNIESLRVIFEITNKDVIFLSTPITFDPFIVELMLALSTGATLFVTENRFNYELIYEMLLAKNDFLNSGITFWHMPPSVFQSLPKQIVDNILTGRSSVRILALGGEKFPDYIFDYPNRSRKIRIFNLYGITEVSCWASVEELADTPVISLGKTLKDTIFQIRNDEGIVLEKGQGHLFIGSEIRQCLIEDEIISDLVNKIIFRETGDLVQYDEQQHKYYYLGRKNDIFKRLGHKINLNTMEKLVYNATELISVCIWDQNTSKLLLFVVLLVKDVVNKTKIIDKLRIKLLHCLPPEYHPDYVEIINQIPLTNNGKIDKKRLLKEHGVINKVKNELTPQESFQKIWCKHFGNDLEKRGNTSFISLGGNSILAIQIVSEFESEVKDVDGGKLTELLLDKNKNYNDYLGSLTKVTNSAKMINTENAQLNISVKMDILQNVANNITLKIDWKHDLKACVDCTVVAFTHKSLGNILLTGCHSHLFTIFKSESGEIISQTILPDAIEGTACISECHKWTMIGCNDGNVYCICIESGTIFWIFSTASSVKSTPILTPDKQKIIFGSYDKHLYCLGIKDGILVWKTHINQSIKSNVIIKDNGCYVASLQGSYYCISIDSGTIIWNIDTKESVFGSPCIIEKDNMIMWINVKGNINSFDCTSGQKLWTFVISGTVFSSLCQFDDKLVSFSCFDQNCIYFLRCTRNSCEKVQTINVGDQISSNPFLFTLNNSVHCLSATNKGLLQVVEVESNEIQQRIQLPNEVFSSPILVNDRIFVGCRDNHIYCIKMYLNS